RPAGRPEHAVRAERHAPERADTPVVLPDHPPRLRVVEAHGPVRVGYPQVRPGRVKRPPGEGPSDVAPDRPHPAARRPIPRPPPPPPTRRPPPPARGTTRGCVPAPPPRRWPPTGRRCRFAQRRPGSGVRRGRSGRPRRPHRRRWCSGGPDRPTGRTPTPSPNRP